MSQKFNFYELKASNRLPSPSGTALKIMKLLQQDNVDINDVAKLIKLDPALSGRVLQFANSATVGARHLIRNINDAVIMIGMTTVKQFALSLSLVGDNHGRCQNFDYSTYWSKSLAAAVVMSTLSIRERIISPDEAFTFGLLKDIGCLALATAWSESFSECITTVQQGDELLKLEQERFAIDHNALTLMLLEDWGFSDIFIESLELSFVSDVIGLSRATRLAKQLVFTNKMVTYCLADETYRTTLMPDLMVESLLNGFSEEDLTVFIADVLKGWQEWGKIINIKTDIRELLPNPSLDVTNTEIAGLNILIVSDDMMMLAQLSKQLTAVGHRVATVKDGDAALKYVLEYNKPELIIIPCEMESMSGIELSKTLHSSTYGRSIYIIMLMSTEECLLIEAFNAGIDDYVTIPVNFKNLLVRINAGQRIIRLQCEVAKERKDLQRYIAELAVANRRLELMANTDVLTSLANRRYSLLRLEQEWINAKRTGHSLSILMLDLDHFKSVNDTLGHDAGDLVLIQVAKIIKACTRSTDIPSRLGGEEFLIITPNTEANNALILAERIRHAVETNQIENMPLLKPMTVSIGVACLDNGVSDWKVLLKLADDALYDVKREKRNGVKLERKIKYEK